MRGDPAMVYSDRGPILQKLQLICILKTLKTGVGTEFPNCRPQKEQLLLAIKDGLAESMVNMLKRTRVNLTAGVDLNFNEFLPGFQHHK